MAPRPPAQRSPYLHGGCVQTLVRSFPGLPADVLPPEGVPGLAGLVVESVNRCDADVRKDLYQHVVLAGRDDWHQSVGAYLGGAGGGGLTHKNVHSSALSAQLLSLLITLHHSSPSSPISLLSLTLTWLLSHLAPHPHCILSFPTLLPRPHVNNPGGTSLVTQMRERLEQDISAAAPGGTKVKVTAPVNPTERRHAVWIGAQHMAHGRAHDCLGGLLLPRQHCWLVDDCCTCRMRGQCPH